MPSYIGLWMYVVGRGFFERMRRSNPIGSERRNYRVHYEVFGYALSSEYIRETTKSYVTWFELFVHPIVFYSRSECTRLLQATS